MNEFLASVPEQWKGLVMVICSPILWLFPFQNY